MPLLINASLLSYVLSYYNPKKILQIVSISKRIQNLMDISIKHYQIQSSFKDIIKPIDDFCSYVLYYFQHYNIKSNLHYLTYYLLEYSQTTNKVFINPQNKYVQTLIKLIPKNIVLTITTTKNIIPSIKNYSTIVGVNIILDSFTEEDINYLFDSIIPISIEFFSFKSNNLFKSEGNTLLKRLNKLPYLKEIKLKGIILDNCWKEYNNFKNITKIESICFNFNNPIKKRKIKKILNHLQKKSYLR